MYDCGLDFASEKNNVNASLEQTNIDNKDEPAGFDLDTYFILMRFLRNESKHELHGLQVIPLIRI